MGTTINSNKASHAGVATRSVAGILLAACAWGAHAAGDGDFYWGTPTVSGFDSAVPQYFTGTSRAQLYTFTLTEVAKANSGAREKDSTIYSPSGGHPQFATLNLPLLGPSTGTVNIQVTGRMTADFNGSSTGTGSNYATAYGGLNINDGPNGVNTGLATKFQPFFNTNGEKLFWGPKPDNVDTAPNYSANNNPDTMDKELFNQTFEVAPGQNTVTLNAELLSVAFARGPFSGSGSSSEANANVIFTASVENVVRPPIPEPQAFALLLGGIPLVAGMARRARRRRLTEVWRSR